MKAKALILAVVLLALLPMATFAGKAWNRGGSSPRFITVEEYCTDATELELLGLINDYRAANGLHALAADQRLGAAAEHHSWDMALTATYSHTLSDGTTWSQNISNHGYTSFGRGENIAWGYTSVEAVFNAWKSSSGHNANMLNSNYRAIGVSLVIDITEPEHTNDWSWTNTFGSALEVPAVVCNSEPTVTPDPNVTPSATNTPASTATPAPTKTPKPCKWGSSWKCSGESPAKGIGKGVNEP
jgi:uncharacterized protein YkwD